MLSDRKKTILRAVVEGYIDKAAPISSNAVKQSFAEACSSATIRNELSALESMGYLIQPHVSSGRIPSEKAFRFYVDELRELPNLSAEDLGVIRRYMDRRFADKEDLLSAVMQTISELTDYTSVVVKSDMSDSIVAIRLVDLRNGQALAVVVTDSRVMKDGILDVPAEFDGNVLEAAERWLNELFVGKHVSEFINFDYPYALSNEQFRKYDAFFKRITDVLKRAALENGMSVKTFGENKIFRHTEYADTQNAEKFLQRMQCRQEIAQLFTDDGGQNGSVTIKIGGADNAPDGCSVVTTRVSLGSNVSGSIGVIGPVRMNYKKVLRVLDVVSGIINNLMGE